MVPVQSGSLCSRKRTLLFSDSPVFLILKSKNCLNLLQDLAASIDESDVVKFTDVVKEFDSMSRLVSFLMTFWVLVTNEGQAICGSLGNIMSSPNLLVGPQIDFTYIWKDVFTSK